MNKGDAMSDDIEVWLECCECGTEWSDTLAAVTAFLPQCENCDSDDVTVDEQ